MSIIRTVTGDIKSEQLGWCQCHEHIFVADGPSRSINKALYIDEYDKSLAEVILYKNAGGQSFVDAQPFKCGRMAGNLARVSEQAGVNIIACTGFHKQEFFEDAEWLQRQTEDFLTDIYIREVLKGMESNGDHISAKAGIVKCAAIRGEHNADGNYAKLFAAAANAARATGVPILVHFDPGADAFSVVKFFEQNGVEAKRLMLCHLDRTKYDFGYHKELASAGSFLEYDTIRREKYHSDDDEIKLIEHIVNTGYAKNLLLGLDTTNERLKSYGSEFGLDDILIRFRFLLEERIGKDIIKTIMIDNPAKALSISLT